MPNDAHQHFWTYSPAEMNGSANRCPFCGGIFWPKTLRPELENSNFQDSIAVQERQTLEETRWLLELAERSPGLLGVVGLLGEFDLA